MPEAAMPNQPPKGTMMLDTEVVKYSEGGLEISLKEIKTGRSFEIREPLGKLWFSSEEAAVKFFSKIIEKINNNS